MVWYFCGIVEILLVILLVWRVIMWLVVCIVFGWWVIIIWVMFVLLIVEIIVFFCWRLRWFVVLLRSNMCGFWYRVWVMRMCCFCFLDKVVFILLISEWYFIGIEMILLWIVVSWVYFLICLGFGFLVKKEILLVIDLVNNWLFCIIILIMVWYCLILMILSGLLLIRILFLFGVNSLVSSFNKVVFL